jgi:CheY-like chemotaxis protein
MDKKVLVLDDEPMVGRLLTCFLEINGYDSIYFSDPLEALSALRSSADDYFLIFSDFNMHGLNGDELAKSIRKDGIDIPIVLMTGDYIVQGDFDEGLINMTLMKPVDLTELQRIVTHYRDQSLQAV